MQEFSVSRKFSVIFSLHSSRNRDEFIRSLSVGNNPKLRSIVMFLETSMNWDYWTIKGEDPDDNAVL